MFSDFGSNGNLDEFDKAAEFLRQDLKKNSIFKNFSEKRQKHLLKGDNAFYLNRDEIEERIGNKVSDFRGMYKILSSQTHSLPMSFYRMVEHEKRGTGVENSVDKMYIAMTLDYISQYVFNATKRMIELIPEIENSLDKKTIEYLNKPYKHFDE